jgi:hypothetical protein
MKLEKIEEEIPNGWDEYFCFNIVDFTPGSAIIVRKQGGREKGIVTEVDYKQFAISYRKTDGKTSVVNINSIVLLQDGSREWLTNPL